MHRQIFHDHDVATLERRRKALFDIGKKHRSIHRAINHERRRHLALAQSRHERHRYPMSMRRVADQTLALRAAASLPYHRAAGAGLIDKHQSCGVKQALPSHPTSARASYVGAFLLRRAQNFF
jgi:hypothetical protein